MPIADLQIAAQKIAGFLGNLNKLGGLRLKYRITAGDGAADPEGLEARAIFVELAGPDVPLVTQHNGELLRALETIAAQILRLDQREHDLVSFDAGNFKALQAAELRLQAEVAADKVIRSGIPFRPPTAANAACCTWRSRTLRAWRRPVRARARTGSLLFIPRAKRTCQLRRLCVRGALSVEAGGTAGVDRTAVETGDGTGGGRLPLV